MNRQLLKSKIHRARVTGSGLHHVGSITVDPELLEAADVLEHELVHVDASNRIVNVNSNVDLLEVPR